MRRLIIIFGLILTLITVTSGTPGLFRMSKISRPGNERSQTNVSALPGVSEMNEQISSSVEAGGNQRMREYAVGYRLGECLVAGGCQVFVGTIQRIGDPEIENPTDADMSAVHRKISITVDEHMWGNVVGPNIQLISVLRPKFTKTAIGPWTAWETANLKVGERLQIALWGEKAQRPQWEGTPEKVALAISDATSITALREIIQQHGRYEQSPDEFLSIAQRPDITSNSFFLGYAMAYLKKREEIRNVDDAALIFSALLKNKQIPDYVEINISFQLLGNFYRLSDKSRKAATEALVIAGAGDYSRLAESAINVLVRLGDDKLLDMSTHLTPARQRKLIENYQLLIARAGPNRQQHPEFESQLGIKIP